MHVVFRVDASIDIGSGHVMRCLTLANALAAQGARCSFVMREHRGHLFEAVRSSGHEVYPLSFSDKQTQTTVTQGDQRLQYESWLGAAPGEDALQTSEILKRMASPDWLVVDHYGIDKQWETILRPHAQRLMVIDDLANRVHECDLLLDQNLGRAKNDYIQLIPDSSLLLVGPFYALLRPEFNNLRSESLAKRTAGGLINVLITLGGVDKNNISSRIVHAIGINSNLSNLFFNLVVGPQSIWLEALKATVDSYAGTHAFRILSGVSNMGQLMVDADLCIGAAGSTVWERCALGLPTCMVVLAPNQAEAASAIEKAGAAYSFDLEEGFPENLIARILRLRETPQELCAMSQAASDVTDGLGCMRVLDAMKGQV